MQHTKFLNLYILVIMLVCCEFFVQFCNALLLSVMESFYSVYHTGVTSLLKLRSLVPIVLC